MRFRLYWQVLNSVVSVQTITQVVYQLFIWQPNSALESNPLHTNSSTKKFEYHLPSIALQSLHYKVTLVYLPHTNNQNNANDYKSVD